MLSKEDIERQLDTKWAACNIVYKDVTDSTNNDARDLAADGAPHGTLVVADKQEAGRGSRGRSWETPAGTNIAMSVVLRPDAPGDRISMLTLIMGLSVAEGIDLALEESGTANTERGAANIESGTANTEIAQQGKELTASDDADHRCKIKWPNDVVIDKRKICGILTELHMNPDNTIRDVVIGVGINVNMTDFPEDIKDIAGSLLSQTGKAVDRSLVVARVMERFEENYEKFQEGYDLSGLKEQYESRLINKGERVKILDPREGFEGTALGITELGELLVDAGDADSGSLPAAGGNRDVRKIRAGEVSVRGLYSYV